MGLQIPLLHECHGEVLVVAVVGVYAHGCGGWGLACSSLVVLDKSKVLVAGHWEAVSWMKCQEEPHETCS